MLAVHLIFFFTNKEKKKELKKGFQFTISMKKMMESDEEVWFVQKKNRIDNFPFGFSKYVSQTNKNVVCTIRK